MDQELRELLMNVLRVSIQLDHIADEYDGSLPDISTTLRAQSHGMLELGHQIESVLGGWQDPFVDGWEDLSLLDDGVAPDWEDAQYEPFEL